MKRDMDLCREILRFIESSDPGVFTVDAPALAGAFAEQEQDAVDYHVALLVDAGFIDATGTVAAGAPVVKGLTWQGHEFMEKCRDEGLWEKGKQLLKEKTGGIALELLSPVLTSLAKQALGIGG